MAEEEKTGKKWEGPGEPTGQGGTGEKEKTEAEVVAELISCQPAERVATPTGLIQLGARS